ncbi:hypothetical protein JVT61DRAFT_15484 [Boletus reticuloceps]|uniref:Uncharacterized protein n=1 Tax=Boletus reticuloceps TaxID=495285 RepID=A0A8I2YCD8_9AGAM|nr:hypothetical protein JVT61DRAFT_15484 [Boletus reticuloceps]
MRTKQPPSRKNDEGDEGEDPKPTAIKTSISKVKADAEAKAQMDQKMFSCLFSPFRTNVILSKREQKVLKKDPKSKQLTLDSSFAYVPPTVTQPSQHPAPSPTHATDVQDKQVNNPTAQDANVDNPVTLNANVDENMGDMSSKDSTHEVAQDAVDMDTDNVPSLTDNVALNDTPGSATDTSPDMFVNPPFTQCNPSMSTLDNDIPISKWEPTQSPRRTLVLTQVNTETDSGMSIDDSNGKFSSLSFNPDHQITTHATPCIPMVI